ncbi:MAG: type IV toxin-antitoxin system AbiEi family antitoxin domain-containing protein [Mycobacteriales bacterium]|nr:type IV toxin-antitoxin system AbiEi family antitoxin domain-containing protein [Frankia sp.]
MPAHAITPEPLRGRVFTNADARAAGLTFRQVAWAVRSGRWTALRRGVYVETSVLRAADEMRRHLMFAGAAALTHRGALVSRMSAAVAHDVPLLAPLARPVVTVDHRPALSSIHRADVVIHREPLDDVDRAAVAGYAVTSPARLVIDLARSASFDQAVVAADTLLHRGAVSEADLAAAVTRLGHLARIEQAHAVVAFADPKAESPLESISRVGMRDHHLPRPATQQVICDALGFVARVDFLFVEECTVGLADGLTKYVVSDDVGARDPTAQLRAEKLQQQRLEDLGLSVVRWGWTEAVNDFGGVARRLRAAFAHAQRRRAG